jgi:hypothetical protein
MLIVSATASVDNRNLTHTSWRHHCEVSGTLCKNLESGIFGTHFQKMQNSQIP